MKKKIIVLLMSMIIALPLAGCNEAERVSYNLSQQADNFNVLRQVTVINCIANEDGTYSKHIIGLSDNVTYVVEDIDTNYVEKYKFVINYNPKMWIPVEFETVD